MPIYSYKCQSCGYSKDVLQKISDPLLTQCPECGAATFQKQLTAAGFQLKGSGWYATDFRDNKTQVTPKAEEAQPTTGDTSAPATAPDQVATASNAGPAAAASPAPAPASSAPAPAPTPK